MNALTWPLIHFAWQGAFIAAALWVSLRVARASRTRYALAAAALFLMAAAPVLTYLDRPVALGEIVLVTGPSSGGGQLPAAGWLVWLPYAWAVGVGLASVRLVRAALATRALRVGARPVENRWPWIVDRAVAILESARVKVPAQCGVWRPAILVPVGFLAQLPPAQVEAILAHEMAHVRRHDYLVNLLQVVVETLLFYHPGVWWVSSVMRREREHCADELALTLIEDRSSLAEALLSLEECRDAGFAPAANGGELKSRVERILRGSQGRGSLWPALAAVALVLGWTALRAQPPSEEARELDRLRTEVKKLRSEVDAQSIQAPQDEASRLRVELAELRAKLAAMQRGIGRVEAVETERELAAKLEAEIEAQKGRAAKLEAEIAAQKGHTVELQEANSELMRARARLDELRVTYRETHPDLLAMRQRVAELERRAADVETNAEIARRRAGLQREIETMRKEGAMTPKLEQVYDQALADLDRLIRDARDREPGEVEAQARRGRAEIEKRMAEAVKRFSTAGDNGAVTPRGRIYVENGPPDEIEKYADGSEAWRYRDGRIFRF